MNEATYYPDGLKISGLCAKAFNKLPNEFGYQGNYSEEEEETGYDEFALRMYDPTIGRWLSTDPYDEFASPYVGMGNDPVNNVDPDGGGVWDPIGKFILGLFNGGGGLMTTGSGQLAHTPGGSGSGGGSFNLTNGLLNFGAALVGSAVGGAIFPLPTPDARQLQNPEKQSNQTTDQTNQNTEYWIKYSGKKVNIYQGNFEDESNSVLIESFAGTSGGTEYQNSKYQDIPRKGPVPEGNYSVDLSISPRNRKVSYAPDGQTNQDFGIQQMVDRSGSGFNAEWGRWRARLQKTSNNTSRDAFYFHDSYKGYSHGCIETETNLFYFLLSLHDAGVLNIKVQVQYPNGNSPTNGGTKGLPLKVPDNVLPYYKKYGYPPGSIGNKRYGKIPVPPPNYKYIPEYKFVPNK